MWIAIILASIAVGVAIAFYLNSSRLKAQQELSEKVAQATAEANAKAEARLLDMFKAASGDALRNNNQAFLDLAKTHLEKYQEMAKAELDKKQTGIFELVKPVKESLERVDLKIQELERARAKADETVFQQVKSLIESQNQLKSETANLVQALRAPQGRGRWGEMQLKRVVEMAGMLEHCDFVQQENVTTQDQGRLRPDLIVKLPGSKNIIVDAKAPLMAYLEALEQQAPERKREKLIEHARQVRKHIELLSRKSYWDQFQPAPEFVVLFLPGEAFFSAALEFDPTLIELGVAQNVIVATPTTLIALLRSVAYGWRQEGLAENARAIGELGKELYKRVADMSTHMGRLGKSLENAVDSYNNTVGSLETRVLVSARRFKDLQSEVQGVEIAALPSIDKKTRALSAPELSSKEQ